MLMLIAVDQADTAVDYLGRQQLFARMVVDWVGRRHGLGNLYTAVIMVNHKNSIGRRFVEVIFNTMHY